MLLVFLLEGRKQLHMCPHVPEELGGSPGEKESVGHSYGCINITPILTNFFFLSYCRFLGKLQGVVLVKPYFLG